MIIFKIKTKNLEIASYKQWHVHITQQLNNLSRINTDKSAKRF